MPPSSSKCSKLCSRPSSIWPWLPYELESRDQTILRQWQMRLERAEYEAALAERRYQEVDPSQRLVAATLEKRWNAALLQLEELKNRPTSSSIKKRVSPPPSRRQKSSPRPEICLAYGTLTQHRPKIGSECCGCSLRILQSRSPIENS